jgi:hypothetical protein
LFIDYLRRLTPGEGLMHLRPVERNVVLGLLAIIAVGLLAACAEYFLQ